MIRQTRAHLSIVPRANSPETGSLEATLIRPD